MKSKGKKGGKKASATKLNNKFKTRLAKQGKLKRKKPKKRGDGSGEERKERASVKGNKLHNGHDVEADTVLSDEDVDYFSTPGKDTSFVKSSLRTDPKQRKRKIEDADDVEADFERAPRKLLHRDTSNENMKQLLPIKTKKGKLVPQMIEDVHPKDEEHNEPDVVHHEGKEPNVPTTPEVLPELSGIELMILRKQKLADRRKRIALAASALIENPEANIRKLKEIRLMLEEKDPDVFLTVRKLAMVSLMEIFKDIIPGYRIRITTEEEKKQRVKKDTKSLRDYEESFLLNYRHYLKFLEKSAKGPVLKKEKQFKKTKEKRTSDLTERLQQESVKTLQRTAVRCMSELLVTHPHFNYRNNIITVLVPFMNKGDEQISCVACDAVRTVFKEDRGGDVSLEVVKVISKMIKSRNFKVKRQVLDTFLCLKIKEVNYGPDDERLTGQQRKDMMNKLSKREKKRKKKMKELEKELQETKATEDKKRKLKLHTETIQMVFLTYFRILKGGITSKLLSAVLEGLAKFAHLINVDFFDDLFKVFSELIESGDLTYKESLHCVKTAFTILSGQGTSLNIDPMTFYTHLYNTLFRIHIAGTGDDMPIILNCLDAMVTKRKRQVSQQRVLAFIKRLSTLCLLQSHEGALGLLSAIRSFMLTYKSSELLFDNETQGSGVYLPELPDPEHCNAHNTMLWELTLLKHHYHPVTKRLSTHLALMAPTSGEGQLSADIARITPKELYNMYQPGEELFNPAPPSKTTSKNRTLHNKTGSHRMIQEDFNAAMEKVFMSIQHETETSHTKDTEDSAVNTT